MRVSGGGELGGWGFGGRGTRQVLVRRGFRGGVAFNPVVKRPGQGVSGTYRYAPDGVLAVGEMGVTWGFGVRVG